MTKALKIIFMGTPEFSVPSLKAIIDEGYEVVGVVTSRDKPAGRGRSLRMSEVKKFALDQGDLKILQPRNLKDAAFQKELRELGADLQVVVAFRMLPESVWDMPPMGTINLHASLLPAYRGAAPINWVLINGEKHTGLTTFKLKHAIDTGDILLKQKVDIAEGETAGSLHDKLKIAGAELLLQTLNGIAQNTLQAHPQKLKGDWPQAPKLNPTITKINWAQKALQVDCMIRGLSPYPGAWTTLDGKRLKIYSGKPSKMTADKMRDSGSLRIEENRLEIAVKDGWYQIELLQLEGKRKMPAGDFLKGYRHIEDKICK